MKCQICRKEPAVWAWQPIGPAETPDCFMTPGSHHRGFLLLKVCQACYALIKFGTRFEFTYKGQTYTGTIDGIETVESEAGV